MRRDGSQHSDPMGQSTNAERRFAAKATLVGELGSRSRHDSAGASPLAVRVCAAIVASECLPSPFEWTIAVSRPFKIRRDKLAKPY